MYLAGRSMVPTHNSTIVAALSLYKLITTDLADMIIIARSVEQAGILFTQCRRLIASSELLQTLCEERPGFKEIRVRGTKARLRVRPNDPGTLEGIEPAGLAVMDAYHAFPSSEPYSILRDGLHTRGAQLVVITNAGENELSPSGRTAHSGA